ncbi:hypothetical protein BCR42DRAFT_430599 [Absidia repens]|uniref:Zn(2)-C6 fungal-type domain-containing protein n=1 Tax=Absidia repens TaxID=90262 RepID=A0A1X2HBD9_9FUNG|nr:hypothetical protein BCR42DRAFT_430599 [Absidia repens]
MEVDHSSQQVNPFVIIQYPSPPSNNVQIPSSQQSGSVSQTNGTQNEQGNPPPPKRKRQQTGYACDKCRERRVGCDRGKPTCRQCDGKYDCVYSNHALRLDNVSMRQRMDDMQSTIKRMYDVLTRLEDDYMETVPRMFEQKTSSQYQPAPPPLTSSSSSSSSFQPSSLPLSPPTLLNDFISTTTASNPKYSTPTAEYDDPTATTGASSLPSQVVIYGQQDNPTVIDWAARTGWQVSSDNGLTSIHTNITSYEDLREAVRRALQMSYRFQGPPLYSSPTCPQNPIFVDELPSFGAFEKLGRISSNRPQLKSNSSASSSPASPSSSSSSTSPHSSSASSTSSSHSHDSTHTDHLLETDVMTRLIKQHHQCGFPILVSPARFERHYQQGELKSVVLSSIFCHIAPHACIYHPQLVHLQDFRTLGERFYDHSRMELGLDEQLNLSNIHQRTLLITYDLDLGRVKRAFMHLGLAIRMCFALDLHRPAGYVHCTTAFEREQAKRVFWTVWFFDSMVPHFFAQPSTIRNEDIQIEVPCVLVDFDPTETDQTRFAISLIHVRRLHSEKSLRSFYKRLPESSRCAHHQPPVITTSSLWTRRTYFCILLDYCLLWITLYRPRLPRKVAIRRTSQAAFAMLHLFTQWFHSSPDFDCFFRPYLFHYMSIIQVFKNNITQQDGPRSPALIAQSQAALVQLFHMYRTTPTHRSFAESQLEKDLLMFIQQHGILTLSQLQYGQHQAPDPGILGELMDDPENSEYYGWGIFSVVKDGASFGNNNNNSSGSGEGSSSAMSSTSSSSLEMDHVPSLWNI